MSKRESGAERRARLEEIKKTQKAEQRKRTLLTAGIGLGLGALIIGGTVTAIVIQQGNKVENQPFSSFGVPLAEAGCDDVIDSPTSGGNEHVTEQVAYDTAPPSSGKHNPQWLGYPGGPPRKFYTPDDAPQIESVVHSMEHGHNVLWYLPTASEADLQVLEDLAAKVSDDKDTYKFIVTPWDTSRGGFPEGKTVAMSHWGAETGSLQYCAAVSGEAVDAFVDAHPITDAPETNAP